MDISIIGAGNVGQALGKSFVEAGHKVFYGLKDPNDPKYSNLPTGSALNIADAAQRSNVVLLLTPWKAAREAIKACGNLKGKILIDCTNPIAPDFSGLEIGQTSSGAEMIASWAEGAHLVKCFNQTGYENMGSAKSYKTKPVMFVAGDDEAARKITAQLASDIGFETIELKSLKMSRQLEQLAWLWIDLAFKQGAGKDFAFSIIRK